PPAGQRRTGRVAPDAVADPRSAAGLCQVGLGGLRPAAGLAAGAEDGGPAAARDRTLVQASGRGLRRLAARPGATTRSGWRLRLREPLWRVPPGHLAQRRQDLAGLAVHRRSGSPDEHLSPGGGACRAGGLAGGGGDWGVASGPTRLVRRARRRLP